MATFSKVQLTGSTDGRGIEITTSGTPGTLIHTATATANEFDEIYLWAINHQQTAIDLLVEFGGTAAGDAIEVAVPPQQGLVALTPGLPIDNGVVARAFVGASASVSGISIHGFVNRINQA